MRQCRWVVATLGDWSPLSSLHRAPAGWSCQVPQYLSFPTPPLFLMWRQYLSYRIILKIKWMPGKHVASIMWILTPMSIYRSQYWWLTAPSSPKSSGHPWLLSLLFTSCINSLSPIDFKFQGHLTFIILSSSPWCKAAFSLTWVPYSSQQSPCFSL